ncbi:hypothetical protein Scep_011404 [Stephania cephalantha]|uniref:Uncharacterized protein n=1 Tax=Stephania cephalantha TaxID=152367 RepID=A0AAP0P8V9_9MAGN
MICPTGLALHTFNRLNSLLQLHLKWINIRIELSKVGIQIYTIPPYVHLIRFLLNRSRTHPLINVIKDFINLI